MKYNEMTKNFIFRFFECKLSVEETAKLCFRSVNAVKEWDKGKPIPRECRRLMRMHSSRILHHSDEWKGFEMEGNKLKTPYGSLTPQQILMGQSLLHIGAEEEVNYASNILKIARIIAKIKA